MTNRVGRRLEEVSKVDVPMAAREVPWPHGITPTRMFGEDMANHDDYPTAPRKQARAIAPNTHGSRVVVDKADVPAAVFTAPKGKAPKPPITIKPSPGTPQAPTMPSLKPQIAKRDHKRGAAVGAGLGAATGAAEVGGVHLWAKHSKTGNLMQEIHTASGHDADEFLNRLGIKPQPSPMGLLSGNNRVPKITRRGGVKLVSVVPAAMRAKAASGALTGGAIGAAIGMKNRHVQKADDYFEDRKVLTPRQMRDLESRRQRQQGLAAGAFGAGGAMTALGGASDIRREQYAKTKVNGKTMRLAKKPGKILPGGLPKRGGLNLAAGLAGLGIASEFYRHGDTRENRAHR